MSIGRNPRKYVPCPMSFFLQRNPIRLYWLIIMYEAHGQIFSVNKRENFNRPIHVKKGLERTYSFKVVSNAEDTVAIRSFALWVLSLYSYSWSLTAENPRRICEKEKEEPVRIQIGETRSKWHCETHFTEQEILAFRARCRR